jgi:hypothetical protein
VSASDGFGGGFEDAEKNREELLPVEALMSLRFLGVLIPSPR